MKKQGRANPLQAMWKPLKSPASSEVEDVGGQHRPNPHEPSQQEPRRATSETTFDARPNSKRRVKGSRESLMVEFQDRSSRRRHRQPEQLMVDFPSEKLRTRRAHTYSHQKESRKPQLKIDASDTERTAETEVSFDEVIDEVEQKKKDTKKKRDTKKQIRRDFMDKFDWSESSIVWGDEECSSDEESSHASDLGGSSTTKDPIGNNFDRSALFRRSSGGNILSRSTCSRPQDFKRSRSTMTGHHSFRMESNRPSSLWESFSSLNVSRKKLEP